MKRIQVVIGANYGDEGKGRITSYLASNANGANVAVVRFNGGAQAGHTVLSGNKRHVFSHYGSGSFDLVPTIFTSDFVCSPNLFKKENEQLIRKSVIRPDLYVSPDCPVTTPWDVLINQLTELARGSERHGSVGVGFGETLERHAIEQYRLTVSDLLLPKEEFILKMKGIFTHFLLVRQHKTGFDYSQRDAEWAIDLIQNPDYVNEVFYNECQYFLDRVEILDEVKALHKFDHLVFEGAQGLALDQESADFPHVTRSFTGIDNVLRVCAKAKISTPLELFYITRPYFTRHGAGPLSREVDAEGFAKIFNVIDETNKPHEFQGSLRFSTHNIDDMAARVIKDQFKIPKKQIGRITLAVTCLDQILDIGGFPAVLDGKPWMFTEKSFVSDLASRISASHVILCHGEQDWCVAEGRVFVG